MKINNIPVWHILRAVEALIQSPLSEERVWTLLARKLAKEASADEVKELEKLMEDSPELSFRVGIIIQYWSNKLTRETDKAAFQKLLRKIEPIPSTDIKKKTIVEILK